MSDVDYNTTLLQKKVYVLLINYANPKFPRTQKDVCELLAVSKSTVSDATKKLLKLGFIAPYSGMKTNILYRKGMNHKIIESAINSNYLESGEWFDTYGKAIRPSTYAEPYRPTYRAHLKGAWLQFTVAQKGEIARFDNGSALKQTLFGDIKPIELKGSINWYGKYWFNGQWCSIRYQESDKARYFYILPSCKIVAAEELTEDNDVRNFFISQCRPILAHLEKFAGWRFKHDETGDYVANTPIRQGKTQKEYGFDEFLTETVHDYTGDIGIIGSSPFWFDKSSGAQGGPCGEMETSKADYVNAIDNLPKTTAIVERTSVDLERTTAYLERTTADLEKTTADLERTTATVEELQAYCADLEKARACDLEAMKMITERLDMTGNLLDRMSSLLERTVILALRAEEMRAGERHACVEGSQ